MYMATKKDTQIIELEHSRSMATQPAPGDPIYDLSTAAAILNCNERILAEKFRQGVIPAKKKLGKWLTTHSRLLKFINS
jgi:hypothetical protein